MTLSIFVKLLLLFLFVPLAYGATWAAKSWLPQESFVRAFLERNGIMRVAGYVLFATYTIGGALLTVMYS